MLFSSLTFLYAFLPVTVLLYFLLPSPRWRSGVLVAASLVFYAWGDPRSLPLLIGTALLVWLCGLGIAEGSEKLRRCCFALALTLLIGSLFLLKYLTFFADTFSALTGIGLHLRRLALPAAISFTTFQLLSYVIDVKRGDVPVERSFSRFLIYISFFPQLMQGPIVRPLRRTALCARPREEGSAGRQSGRPGGVRLFRARRRRHRGPVAGRALLHPADLL